MSDDQKLIRIEDKIDGIHDKISAIDTTLAAQHESLKHHIKRTDMLEAELKPIRKHVDMVSGALKFIGIIAALVAIIEFIRSIK